MADNMPVLYRNIMDGLPSDFAREVFLWAVDLPGEDRMCYRAEAFAREADSLVKSLRPMLDASAKVHGISAHDPDLMSFLMTRHANFRLGGNLKPTYA